MYVILTRRHRGPREEEKKGKNRQEKRYCGRSVSRCEADCSLRWNCSTETLRNNWWLLAFFFSGPVRSGGRTPLVAFDNFIRHGWPYVCTILPRWHVSFRHDLSLIRIYSDSCGKFAANTGDTCTPGEPERTFGPRTTARTCRNRS